MAKLGDEDLIVGLPITPPGLRLVRHFMAALDTGRRFSGVGNDALRSTGWADHPRHQAFSHAYTTTRR
jgi:hypothetical protein